MIKYMYTLKDKAMLGQWVEKDAEGTFLSPSPSLNWGV